jgi:hypothetical protein
MRRARHLTKRYLSVLAICVGAVVLCLGTTARGQTYPQNIGPIELANVQWQLLPLTIREVFVGPDGRIWYQLYHPDVKEDLSVVRRIIEGQFQETSPQLYGAEPALFETTGRVWFRTKSYNMLLGYDGHQWVQRAASAGVYFRGNCPRHGRMGRCEYNLEVAGTLFFPDDQGVHTFAGQTWNYQPMGATTTYKRIVLRAEPMDRGVIAINPGNLSRIWYYRQGQWHEEVLPEPGIRDILPSEGDGVWLLTTNDALQFHSFSGDVVDIPKLPSRPWSPRFRLLHCDSLIGRCFLTMEGPADRGLDLQQDLVILNAGQEPVVVSGYKGPQKWDAVWTENSGPIFTADGRSVWIPGQHDSKGCDKLDLTTAMVTDTVPDRVFYWIHAVHPDGTLFISTREPGQLTFALAAYRPGTPMPANVLDVRTYALQSSAPHNPAICVDSTGEVSAVLENRGLCRFDGTQWQPVEGLSPDDGHILLLLPGTAGRIIVGTDARCYYRKDGVMIGYRDLRDLITENLADVAANYQTAAPQDRWYYAGWPVSVVADKAGNIWLQESPNLSVFTNGQWLDASAALLANGSPTGDVEYLNTVGGRGAVYVTDFAMLYEHGRSFFLRVDNGRVVVSPAPQCVDRAPMRLSIRDPSDALWIPGTISAPATTFDFIYAQLAQRATETGVIQEFKNLGWAMLCDAAGVVWMGEIRGEFGTKFNLWRNGEIHGQIDIPYGPNWLFSDREGSVYVWTRGGLYHLTASASSGYTDYAVSEYYLPPAVPGNILQFAYSENGFIVLRTYSDGIPPTPRVYYVVMIPIPVPK